MTIPWPGGPDSSVSGADPSAQVAQGLQQMSRQLSQLNQTITAQNQQIQRTLSAASRYQMGGANPHQSAQPQMNPQVVSAVNAAGGQLNQSGLTATTPLAATTSLQGLQSYVAQQIGQWIAGVPLYQPGSGPGSAGAGAPAPAPPAGGAPVAPVAPGAAPGPVGGLPAAIFGGGQNASRGTVATQGIGVLQRVGAQVAASGGGPGAVTGALRHIPGVGLVMDAANWGTNAYLTQREAGRIYQSVEGGSNIDAQTERLHEGIYQASMYGLMPQADAAQAFGAVTAMGYNQAAAGEGQQPQNRQSALDFIYHNYMATGMDVNQSLSVLQSASGDANVNLTTLSQTLNELSAAAGEAGTNADTARQQFNGYFAAALGQGMGQGSATVAGGISSMQASMGKEFAGVNFSGELSQQRQYLLAGMSGLTPAQLQDLARNSPQAYNKLLAGQNMQFLTSGGLMTSQMQSSLSGLIAKAGGSAAVAANPSVRDQVATQFLNANQVSGNIDENLWAREISQLTGVTMTPTQAFQWIVSQSAGVNEASHNKTLNSSQGGTVPASKPGSAPTGKYGLALSPSGNWAEEIGTLGLMGHGSSWQQVLQKANGPAANAYLAQEKASGRRSPVLEALLQNTGSGDKVAVQTASGQRVMSIADAMRYYPNEMAAGNVEFYDSAGKALGDTASLTNGLVNAGANTAGERKGKAGSGLGQSLKSYLAADKANAAAASVNSQPLTVSLSAEARQLLKLLPSNSDTAAAQSAVPANPWVAQASR